jgi:hypothetical protein
MVFPFRTGRKALFSSLSKTNFRLPQATALTP